MKSALSQRLKGLIQLAVYANRHGLSPSTVIEQRDAARDHVRTQKILKQQLLAEEAAKNNAAVRLSRRDFLKLGAVTAGAAGALWATRGRRIQAAQPRVVIVGGGTAGLTCAYRLQQAGLFPIVIEASGRLGGRMYSDKAVSDPAIKIEYGGEFVDSGHEALRNLIPELGLTLFEIDSGNAGLDPDLYYFSGTFVSDQEIIAALQPMAAALNRDLESLGDGVSYTSDKNSPGVLLDQLSVTDYLDRYEITGMGRQVVDVTFTTEFGGDIADLSALNLLYLLNVDDKDNFYPYGSSDEAYNIREGSGAVPAKLAELLKVAPQTESPLESIRQNSAGEYVLTYNQGGIARELIADHVVLTLPFSTLRNVDIGLELPPVKLKAIRELPYGTNIKTMLEYGSRFWREAPAKSSGDTFSDLSYQNTWETTSGQPGKLGVLTVYNGGLQGLVTANKPLQAAARIYVDELDKVFPGSKAQYQNATRFDWPNFRWNKGSYAYYRPGDYAGFGTVEAEPVGKLYFAGEHTSLISAGYMNGAVETGERAAQELLASL